MGRRKKLILAFCLVFFVRPAMAGYPPTKQWITILTHIQAGDQQKGIYGLKKLLDSNLEPIWQKRALFLLAYTYHQTGKLKEAEDQFSRIMKNYDRMKDYIELELCEIWLAQGKHHKAYEVIKSFREKHPQSPLLYDAYLVEAHTLKGIGSFDQAIRKYQVVIEGEGLRNRKKEAEAIFGWAECLVKTGRLSQAWDLYSKLFFNYPEQTLAGKSWKEMNVLDKHKVSTLTRNFLDRYLKRAGKLMELGHYSLALKDYEMILSIQPPQDYLEEAEFQRVFCLNRLRERAKAEALLGKLISKYPDSHYIPEGLYYLSRLYWHVKDYHKGESVIQRLIKTYPANPWTEKGMLILGLMKEEEGKWSDAYKVYKDMKRQFPEGELLPEVYWREGWTSYVKANYARAAQVFKDLILLSSGEKLRDKAIYWHARALEKIGQRKKAQRQYEELARNYSYSYYGIKGEERWLRSQKSKDNFRFTKEDNSSIIPEDIDWTTEQSHYLERIRELVTLALYEEGQHELKYLKKALSPDISHQYHLAKFLHQAGFYYGTIKILSRILLDVPLKHRNGLPIELWQLLYPLAYWNQVNYQANQNQQDPYLIMAIIRQESAFQSGVISSAGACGLMQILPSTGKFILQSLGKNAFQRQYLFDPDSNIYLGVWYFKHLQNKFDQNLILALAAYNAGPEKVKKWLKAYSIDDPEVFIENIPYRETRGYIKNILRNRFLYQKIYGTKETTFGED